MCYYATVISDTIIGLFDGFRNIISNRPFVSVLFPASGLGATYIPTNITTVSQDNIFLDIIAVATPYLRFIFLLLTLVLAVISLILQWRKVRNKNKK